MATGTGWPWRGLDRRLSAPLKGLGGLRGGLGHSLSSWLRACLVQGWRMQGVSLYWSGLSYYNSPSCKGLKRRFTRFSRFKRKALGNWDALWTLGARTRYLTSSGLSLNVSFFCLLFQVGFIFLYSQWTLFTWQRTLSLASFIRTIPKEDLDKAGLVV